MSGEAIFSAPVAGEAEAPAVGHPQRILGEKFRMSIIGPEYDVAPDGQRFVVLSPLEERGVDPHNVNLVFGWFDELERLAPTGNRR